MGEENSFIVALIKTMHVPVGSSKVGNEQQRCRAADPDTAGSCCLRPICAEAASHSSSSEPNPPAGTRPSGLAPTSRGKEHLLPRPPAWRSCAGQRLGPSWATDLGALGAVSTRRGHVKMLTSRWQNVQKINPRRIFDSVLYTIKMKLYLERKTF